MVTQPDDKFTAIKSFLIRSGLYADASAAADDAAHHWRISPEPYFITPGELDFFNALGTHLHHFYSALNRLYWDSFKGKAPAWVAEYLDLGKPQQLIEMGRMKRFKQQLPGILRPDVIVTEDGFAITELDSVPGGFGATAGLMSLFEDDAFRLVGAEAGGIAELFYRMMETVAETPGCTLAIVVSDEASDYRGEMEYLAGEFRKTGRPVYAVHPRDVIFKEEGLFVRDGERDVALDAVYRFYELFDLKNIPKSELLLYSHKKNRVRTSPPYKAYLEEKLSFALFHHPALRSFWENALGGETFAFLSHLIPETWVLDNRNLPPYGVIPGLTPRGAPVGGWHELFELTQKEREFVVKPSGFSPEAWGSRGVVVGHDVPGEQWKETLKASLERFDTQPSILQVFRKGKVVSQSYFDPDTGMQKQMQSRVRLTPYYFVVEGVPKLGGMLATLCPHDKKKIHGMADAIMVPCAVR